MIEQILALLRQQAGQGQPVMTPNDMGAGGMMPMANSMYQQPQMSMRPPGQEGPSPPVSPRMIMSLLGGNRGSGIATR